MKPRCGARMRRFLLPDEVVIVAHGDVDPATVSPGWRRPDRGRPTGGRSRSSGGARSARRRGRPRLPRMERASSTESEVSRSSLSRPKGQSDSSSPSTTPRGEGYRAGLLGSSAGSGSITARDAPHRVRRVPRKRIRRSWGRDAARSARRDRLELPARPGPGDAARSACNVEGVRTHRLRYPLAGETLYFGAARGLSNLVVSAGAYVSCERGVLLVIETRAGGTS